jgi:glycosyltransferase involved in cell wall biosynthesis
MSYKQNLFVTVIMPVYNAEKFLSQAIESVLNQTYSNFEFLIFDDGSTDNSPHIISKYASADKRIIAFYEKNNLGYVVHLNNGIQHAKGDYIIRMDSDDVSLPLRFQKQIEFLNAHPKVSVVGSSSLRIDDQDQALGVSDRNTASSDLWWQSFFTNPMAHPTVVFRKSIFKQVGLYNPDKIPSEDYDLWVRILRAGRLSNLHEPLLKYREHSSSVSHQKKAVQRKNSIETLKAHWYFFSKRKINDNVAMFFRLFHKGYDELPFDGIRTAYYSILKLYAISVFQQGLSQYIRKDAFAKLLYLALKSRRYSTLLFSELSFLLFLFFPMMTFRKIFTV